MRTLLLLSISILVYCISVSAQYDTGTIIYSTKDNTNPSTIQKNYKVVDFDGDNFVDILFVKDGSPNQLAWYKGDGNGNFTEQKDLLEIDDNHKENEIFYEDMNEDGISDIVFQNSDVGFITLLNGGQGNIINKINNQVIMDDFVRADLKDMADINGDGNIDGIFFTQKDDNDWAKRYCIIGYNKGTGIFNNYEYLQKKPEFLIQAETGDIDGDGYLDIVCNGRTEVEKHDGEGIINVLIPFIKIYQNSENGISQASDIELPAAGNKIAFIQIKLQDINSDSTAELLAEFAFVACEHAQHLETCVYSYKFQVHHYDLSKKTFITSQAYNSWPHGYTFKLDFVTFYESMDNAFQIQFGQKNDDDNLDMLSVTVPQGKLQWNLGNGEGDFVTGKDEVVYINNKYNNNKPALRVADIDTDGDLDVFVLLNTETSSALTVFKNLGQTAEEPPKVNEFIITPNPVAADSFMQFNFDENQDATVISYSLYSLLGSKIIDGVVEWGGLYIPNINTGMYIIEINSDDKKYINKLIVQ